MLKTSAPFRDICAMDQVRSTPLTTGTSYVTSDQEIKQMVEKGMTMGLKI